MANIYDRQLYPGDTALGTQRIGFWVELKSGLDAPENSTMACSCWRSKHISSVVRRIV